MDDLVQSLKSKLPQLRGRLLANEPLAPLTWFRVGGPAQALFMPEDESDLALLLTDLPRDIPVTVIGLGSNLIVRDGGVEGVVIRLGRGFNETRIETGNRVRSGTAVPARTRLPASIFVSLNPRPSRTTTPATPPSRTIRFEPRPMTVTGISRGRFASR